MSAWVLPDHIADVLPSQARHIEELRRYLLDMARCYGYELVMPPMLEHIESLLTGTGQTLDLQTFKLVDQISGRTLGIRADTTPQVARIDAHLLNRQGVTRLCYCGPVLHTRPEESHASREPIQFGAEIFGHAGPEAEREALSLALDCLGAVNLQSVLVDLADVRVVNALLSQVQSTQAHLSLVHSALAAKDASEIKMLAKDFPVHIRDGLLTLTEMYGDVKVLEEARNSLPSHPLIDQALTSLKSLSDQLDDAQISFDLADLGGYGYYSGLRFSIYTPGANAAIVRGGRYDEVGAVFGRNRPAVGFSLDIKSLIQVVEPQPIRAAIRTHWSTSLGWGQAISSLRKKGETVICVFPGHEQEIEEFLCDRELVDVGGRWVLKAI